MTTEKSEMFKFATALAREMVNHKFIIVGLDRYEWRELKDLLLTNGEFTSNHWISKDGAISIRKYETTSDIRGLRYKGLRPSLFITRSKNHSSIPTMVLYTLDPRTKEVKYID